MKDYGFAALILVVAYIAMFFCDIFSESGIDPLYEPYGRLVLFNVWLLLIFATCVFIDARKERRWYTGLSVFLLVIIWLGIILSIIISQINFLGPDFRF